MRGKRYKFGSLLFWAECGMICTEDLQNGDFKVVLVKDFLLRARSILRSINRMKYADEREQHMTMVENAIKACKEAQAQGRPDDPKAVAYILRHKYQRLFPVLAERRFSTSRVTLKEHLAGAVDLSEKLDAKVINDAFSSEVALQLPKVTKEVSND